MAKARKRKTAKKMRKSDVDKLRSQINDILTVKYDTTIENAGVKSLYNAIATVVNGQIYAKKVKFNRIRKDIEKNNLNRKKVYYLSMEFLMGQSLKNNLYNLGETEAIKEILADTDVDIEQLFEYEPDAGLGNGGLGRLSACFMDAMASQGYDETGFSIRYEYGLFKQRIVDGWQVEMPDNWLPGGRVWLNMREDDTFLVKFYGNYEEYWDNGELKYNLTNYEEVEAKPYDMFVSGADSDAVARLRLWKSVAPEKFDMDAFNNSDFTKALQENSKAELISKVLYPADNKIEGKELRLKQEYFMVSASCQNIVENHMKLYGTLDNFSDKVAIHINDTHPALCIPELMRIFMDDYGCTWEYSWQRVSTAVSYTNHTILEEALEKWPKENVRAMLPRVYAIIEEINRRFRDEMSVLFPGDWGKIDYMSIISDKYVHMANLSVIGSHRVNGVSELHSDIIKDSLFHDFYLANPDKFTNVTNGIAHRRWLCQSNPELSALLDECIGDGYRKNAAELSKFTKFKNDSQVLERLEKIKRDNKARFSDKVFRMTGVRPDPDSIFITQAKRLHEYKRQLLNAMRIIHRYLELKANPDMDVRPETYFFAAKTAPSYYMAKEIIQLIVEIGEQIEKEPKIREKMKVIFLENYSVSMAENLMPATEISEQISLAGKEASGTGNMKMMINGAITIGTLDGANVEMHEEVGDDNIYIFGQKVDEVNRRLMSGYRPVELYNSDQRIKKVVDALNDGFNGFYFTNLHNYLLHGSYGVADPYMCIQDFDDYLRVHDQMIKDYADRKKWNRMSLMNIAKSGKFAADRAIQDYARKIWHTKPIIE